MKKIITCIGLLFMSSFIQGQPTLLKDIYPGFASSNPTEFVAMGNKMYFNAGMIEDTTFNLSGASLWVSDGTMNGTLKVKPLTFADGVYVNARNIINFNGTLMFSANTYFIGSELWTSDGTYNGTYPIDTINPDNVGSMGWGLDDRIFQIGNAMYFAATDGDNNHGIELWKSDGTTGGTAMVTDISPGNSVPNGFSVANNKLIFFVAQDIWSSDGSAAGTIILAGVNRMCVSPSKLNTTTALFTASLNTTSNVELWKTDGTASGTQMVKDINPGATASISTFDNIGIANQVGYLIADDGTNGMELWKTDGTNAGTSIVTDLSPGSASTTFAGKLIGVGNKMIFTISNTSGINSVWSTDGTSAGTIKLLDSISGPSNYLKNYTFHGDTLYFTWSNGIYKTDGTVSGTSRIDTVPSAGFINEIEYVNGYLFMSAYDAPNGQELWVLQIGSPTGINENSIEPSVIVYPNPNNGIFSFSSDIRINSITIYDVSGRLIYKTENLNADERIDISSAGRGFYFYEVMTENNKVARGKMVVE
jgi:trimeric autotransporter adhesin